jgi:hypothetical protein
MTYNDFCDAVMERRAKFPTERFGQCAFNTLHDIAPHIADEIRGTDIDPFYTDRMRLFNDYVTLACLAGRV